MPANKVRTTQSSMARMVRFATAEDVEGIASLLDAYMREMFDRPWPGSSETLERDGLGARFETMVVEANGSIIGFASWIASYDLHVCLPGGEVGDLYVAPAHRGRGVAVSLLTAVAQRIESLGGHYIRGQAVQDPAVQRLYDRLAVCFPGANCVVSGRAFRRLAELSGADVRTVLSAFPDRSWNYER